MPFPANSNHIGLITNSRAIKSCDPFPPFDGGALICNYPSFRGRSAHYRIERISVALRPPIGLTQGKTLVLDSMDDLNLAFDLAIHTAPKDRSRAIDRYAKVVRLAPESDESLVLEAMRRARFSIISFVRRHPVAGLIVKDLFRGVEVWLVDEGLESSLPDGAALATRLFTPERFAMTAGILVPLDLELIEDAIAGMPQLLRKGYEEMTNDRRLMNNGRRQPSRGGRSRMNREVHVRNL
jgi:hypothetical protein